MNHQVPAIDHSCHSIIMFTLLIVYANMLPLSVYLLIFPTLSDQAIPGETMYAALTNVVVYEKPFPWPF